MRPLHVVTPYFNPMRWESRLRLYRAFEAHMLASGVHLTTVECAFGDRPFEIAPAAGVNHVQVRAKSLAWTKENLINIGISRLPHDWKYVAWIDGDVTFRKPGWAQETVHALQQYDVIQPWSECYDLGPDDDHLQVHTAFCKIFHQRRPIVPSGKGGYTFAHCLHGDTLVVPGGKVLAASSRPFKGDLVVIRTAAGKEIACSANHPILSDGRWVAAGDISVGDNVVRYTGRDGILGQPDKQDAPARIEDIARSFSENPGVNRSVRLLPDDFHSQRPDSKVATIWSDRFLRDELDAPVLERCGYLPLRNPIDLRARFAGCGAQAFLLKRLTASSPASLQSVCLANLFPSLGGNLFNHSPADGGANFFPTGLSDFCPGGHASRTGGRAGNNSGNNPAPIRLGDIVLDHLSRPVVAHADNPAHLLRALAGQIESDDVVFVGRRHFDGHIYDLKTEHGFIVADDLITHNSGYAWAATRQALEHLGGLIETAALGAGDHHMALALIGRVKESVPGGITDGYLAPLLQWQERAAHHIAGNIGFVPGTIEHGWHGQKEARRYIERWDIVTGNHFDPSTDLKRNVWGVLELAGNKPALRHEIDLYMRQRDEDCNSLG